MQKNAEIKFMIQFPFMYFENFIVYFSGTGMSIKNLENKCMEKKALHACKRCLKTFDSNDDDI